MWSQITWSCSVAVHSVSNLQNPVYSITEIVIIRHRYEIRAETGMRKDTTTTPDYQNLIIVSWARNGTLLEWDTCLVKQFPIFINGREFDPVRVDFHQNEMCAAGKYLALG